jgi:4-amino-4-deoxy-L-arabinose transferase-like glycosyltransferase
MFPVIRSRSLAPALWTLGLAGVLCLYVQAPALGWPLLFVAGLLVLLSPRDVDAEPLQAPSPRVELVSLAVLVLIAAFFRLWRLHEVPPGCWSDEAENGIETLRIMSGDWFVFTPRNGGRGSLQFFWTAPFFALFGANAFALRLAIAVVGIATVPALWFLAKQCASGRIALYAAGFLTLSSWHVILSRLGFDAAMVPLFDALVVLAIVRGCRRGSLAWFAVAGLLAGLENYSYAAARLTPVLAAIAFFVFGTALPTRRRVLAAVIAIVALCLTLTPLALYGLSHSEDMTKRGAHVSMLSRVTEERSLKPVAENALATLRMLHERGDANGRHNLPGQPELDVTSGVLFLAGLGVAWRRRWPREAVLMITWLALVLLFGGMLTDRAPHALRTISALVPVSLFVAWGCEAACSRVSRAAAAWLAIATALLIGAASYRTYFVQYARSEPVRRSFSPRASAVAEYLKAEPAEEVAVVSDRINPSVVEFCSGRDSGHLFFVDPAVMARQAGALYVFSEQQEIPTWGRTPLYCRDTIGKQGWRRFVVLRERGGR